MKVGKHCRMRSIIIFTLHQEWLGWSNDGGWEWCSMYLGWICEKCVLNFTWKVKGRDSLGEVAVGGTASTVLY